MNTGLLSFLDNSVARIVLVGTDVGVSESEGWSSEFVVREYYFTALQLDAIGQNFPVFDY